jgi:hypothetical protein
MCGCTNYKLKADFPQTTNSSFLDSYDTHKIFDSELRIISMKFHVQGIYHFTLKTIDRKVPVPN